MFLLSFLHSSSMFTPAYLSFLQISFPDLESYGTGDLDNFVDWMEEKWS